MSRDRDELEQASSDLKAQAAQRRRDYERWRLQARNEHAPFFSVFAGFLDYLDKRRNGPRLTSTDIRLFIYLGLRANRSGELWYGVDRIAKDLGLGERTVQRALDNLKKANLIDRIQYSPTSVARTFLVPYSLLPTQRPDDNKAIDESSNPTA